MEPLKYCQPEASRQNPGGSEEDALWCFQPEPEPIWGKGLAIFMKVWAGWVTEAIHNAGWLWDFLPGNVQDGGTHTGAGCTALESFGMRLVVELVGQCHCDMSRHCWYQVKTSVWGAGWIEGWPNLSREGLNLQILTCGNPGQPAQWHAKSSAVLVFQNSPGRVDCMNIQGRFTSLADFVWLFANVRLSADQLESEYEKKPRSLRERRVLRVQSPALRHSLWPSTIREGWGQGLDDFWWFQFSEVYPILSHSIHPNTFHNTWCPASWKDRDDRGPVMSRLSRSRLSARRTARRRRSVREPKSKALDFMAMDDGCCYGYGYWLLQLYILVHPSDNIQGVWLHLIASFFCLKVRANESIATGDTFAISHHCTTSLRLTSCFESFRIDRLTFSQHMWHGGLNVRITTPGGFWG